MILLTCDVQDCENAELVPPDAYEVYRMIQDAGWLAKSAPELGVPGYRLVCPMHTEALRAAQDELERELWGDP